MQLSEIEAVIEDIRQGKMVVVMDDEHRENEGDILIASECITPEDVNFMITHARGLVCQTMTQKMAEQLELPMMVRNNTEAFATNFSVSIEAAKGVTTGISTYDRALTIRTAALSTATKDDVVSPGHIFPVIAQHGGVLTRPGHTEAGCDLARLAGLRPSCAIIEIMNEDGSMARRPDLEVFCQQHGLKLTTIEKLIEYRKAHDPIVELELVEPLTEVA